MHLTACKRKMHWLCLLVAGGFSLSSVIWAPPVNGTGGSSGYRTYQLTPTERISSNGPSSNRWASFGRLAEVSQLSHRSVLLGKSDWDGQIDAGRPAMKWHTNSPITVQYYDADQYQHCHSHVTTAAMSVSWLYVWGSLSCIYQWYSFIVQSMSVWLAKVCGSRCICTQHVACTDRIPSYIFT